MKSVSQLINQIRKQTENEEVSDFTGIQDSEFIQYLNDAQYMIQAAIAHQHPSVFTKETTIDAIADQEKYNLPDDCYLNNKVYNVEYSPTGEEDDFYVLEQDTIKRRNPGVSGSPVKYIRLSGQILLTPQPQTGGKIRINYVQRLRELDKRSAKVLSDVTVSPSAQFTISLDQNTFSTETESLQEHDFICVVDKLGNNVVKNIEIVSVAANQIVCKAHSIDAEDISTIPAGSFIVGGRFTTTHSDLSKESERYLIAYSAWKILKRDSSVDSSEAVQELETMANELVKTYALISDDIQFIPQLNSWDDWSV